MIRLNLPIKIIVAPAVMALLASLAGCTAGVEYDTGSEWDGQLYSVGVYDGGYDHDHHDDHHEDHRDDHHDDHHDNAFRPEGAGHEADRGRASLGARAGGGHQGGGHDGGGAAHGGGGGGHH